jgi:hypothetical protein
VVAIEHHAVALIGAKGGGKSTLSLALAQRGAVLVSDDVAPIVTRDGVFAVPGGRSALRMRPDAAASFGVTAGDHPAVYASVESPTAKRLVDLAGPGRPDPSWLPLGAVFILAPRGSAKAVEVRALSAGDLLPVLLGNRHMPRLLDPAGHRRDFSCLGALAQAVPGRRLVRPDDLDAVGSAAEAVIDATRRLYAGDESVGSLSA